MTTKTDFHSLMELKESFHPQGRRWINNGEAELIKRALELETRSNIELQNIRDMRRYCLSVFQ